MKKQLTILLLASLWWACNDAANKNEAATEAAQHHHEEATGLILNNGAKWKSDDSTNKNVAALEAVASGFGANNGKALSDYIAVGNAWRAGLDKMIKECRMKGADHDALHLWLEPLLKKVGSLQQATTKEEASELFADIKEQLHIYHQYFA